jgi:hypothetical protein
VVEVPLLLVSRVPEHAEHGVVVRECVGHEPGDAALASGGGQMLKHQGAEAPALMSVRDDEGDFCRVVGREPVEARHGHQLVVDQRD